MATDLLGKSLGDFEIVRELGRGGMGVVYEARQISLSRRVALKVLAGMSLTKRAVDRFHREAEAAAKLHHTNIVPVYATGEQNGTHFYAMELIDGPSLDRVVKQLRQSKDGDGPSAANLPVEFGLTGPFIETPLMATPSDSGTSSGLSSDHKYFDTVAGMITDVADALDHAHKNNVLHRDIKPSNLLLAPDGRLSINDFGLARMLEQPGMTMTGEFVGTPAYMSPEQITSGRIPIDHRTDIYSLGATLYELCTLQPPFVGERRDQLLALVVQKEPKPLRAINKRVPLDLETICLKCLEKDPDRRYQTGKELADDLRRFVNRFAISARRVGVLGRTKKWMKRNPAVAALLAIAFLAIGTAGFFAWRSHEAEELRLTEQKQREEETRSEKRREAIRNGMVEAMAGNFAGVDKAIDEAIQYEADAADVRILRGFAASHNGRYPEAVTHYEEAVRMRPDSVVARAGLTEAYSGIVDYFKEWDSYRILAAMTPESPEDFLFKGWASYYFDETGSLNLIEEGLRRKPMNIGFLLRASARSNHVFNTASLDDLDKALRDTATSREILRDHPRSLMTGIETQMAAVVVYRIHKLSDNKARAVAEGDKLEAMLAGFPENPDAANDRILWLMFHSYELGEPLVIPDFSAIRKRTGNRMLACLEGEDCFRKGKDREAIELLRSQKGNHYADVLRFFATLDSEEFAAERENMLKDGDGIEPNGLQQYAIYKMRRAAGRSREATEGLRNFIKGGGKMQKRPYWAQWEKYYFSDAADKEEELLKTFADSRYQQGMVFVERGLRYLGEGNRTEAILWLRKAADYIKPGMSGWAWSTSLLDRMKLDPTWPKSIPAKK